MMIHQPHRSTIISKETEIKSLLSGKPFLWKIKKVIIRAPGAESLATWWNAVLKNSTESLQSAQGSHNDEAINNQYIGVYLVFL
jgi:hypothetical protein